MTKRDEIQQLGLNALASDYNAGIAISMGVGKTFIGLQYLNDYANFNERFRQSIKFLVVAPKKSIFKSWIDEAEKHGFTKLKEYITFSTYLSLSKQPTDYDVVILDECHNLLEASHDFWLSMFRGEIKGLTGTPPKFAGSEKGKMIEKYCPIKYEYITDNAVDDGILNDYKIIVHKLPLSTSKTYWVKTKTKSWPTSEYDNYTYWCHQIDSATNPKQINMYRIMRMTAMKSYPGKEKLAKKLLEQSENKCILFANTQEQADQLCKHSYHSANEDSELNLLKFKQGVIRKLSAVLQLNEGVNIPDLKEGIIMHAYGNERKSAQRIGRLLRLNPDDVSTTHILCYKDTIDEEWVRSALEGLDPEKITYLNV